MTSRGYLILLGIFNVFWAGTLIINKMLEPYLDYTSIVTLRFGVAALAGWMIWPFLRGPGPTGWGWFRVIVMGLIVFAVGHRLQVYGNQIGSAGNSAVLMGLEPVLTSVAAAIFLREHVPVRRWFGFSLGLLGVALLNGLGRGDFHWAGLYASVLFCSSFLSEAAYSLISKPILHRTDPMKITVLSLTFGTMANLVVNGVSTYREAVQLPWAGWLGVIYLAVLCTTLGYGMWLMIIRHIDVNLAAMSIFVQPIAGLLLALTLLQEKLHAGHLWGTLVIGAGLVLGCWEGRGAAVPKEKGDGRPEGSGEHPSP